MVECVSVLVFRGGLTLTALRLHIKSHTICSFACIYGGHEILEFLIEFNKYNNKYDIKTRYGSKGFTFIITLSNEIDNEKENSHCFKCQFFLKTFSFTQIKKLKLNNKTFVD